MASLIFRDIPRFELGDWWKEEELPLDLSKYGNFNKIVVEVGFGFGEFLFALSEVEKESLFIGIEKYGKGIRKITDIIKKKSIYNIIPLCGDAYVIFQVLFADNSIDKVIVNFPDPWPKKRHQNRRLLTEEFFRLASRKLRGNGELFFATDDENLAKFAIEEISKVEQLENINHPHLYILESPYLVKTRYEKKWIKEGKKLYYFIYRKKNATY
mgnify:CR=1 FL=1